MVSITGAIGFVGLVVPHAARFLVGTRHARLVPVSALIGMVFLIAADVIARMLVPGQTLPIGVVITPTAVITVCRSSSDLVTALLNGRTRIVDTAERIAGALARESQRPPVIVKEEEEGE